MLNSPIVDTPSPIQELYLHVYQASAITENDVVRLKLLLHDDTILWEDRRLVKRILYAVKRGWLQIVGGE